METHLVRVAGRVCNHCRRPLHERRQAETARALLSASRDGVCISDLVVAESYFLLRHHYAVLHTDATQALAALLDDPRVQYTGVLHRVLRDVDARGSLRAVPGVMDQLILADSRSDLCTFGRFHRHLANSDDAQRLSELAKARVASDLSVASKLLTTDE